jgi:hypothetical protein
VAQQQLRDNEQRDHNTAVIDREAEGRASGNDALKNLLRTQYIQNATGYTPKAGLPSYGFGPQASTDAEKQGASAFGREAMTRLEGGNQIPEIGPAANFTIDPKLLKAGMFEKLAGIAGPGLSMFELLSRHAGTQPTPEQLLGDALPGAGGRA